MIYIIYAYQPHSITVSHKDILYRSICARTVGVKAGGYFPYRLTFYAFIPTYRLAQLFLARFVCILTLKLWIFHDL